MTRDSNISRRKTMKLAGVTAATALVAGCSGDDDEGNGDENGDESGDTYEIDPGTQVDLEGQIGNWVGIAPSELEGVENPTLVLQAGEDYELGWSEGDGNGHNIEIRDENGDVVNDLSTDVVEEPGDDQWLEFTASSDMVEYVCNPHSSNMAGEIQVEGEADDMGGDDMNGDENTSE